MSNYPSNNREEWSQARAERCEIAKTKAIKKCKEMLAEIPDRIALEPMYCEKCTRFKRSAMFLHALECIKCGNIVEHPQHARDEIYETSSNAP